MSPSLLLDFLRRELAPTPGRGSATFRLTLACLAATVPILTHHIQHALMVMIVMYLITQEDTAATLIGSVMGVVGITVGLLLSLLALMISLDVPWLRILFLAAFFFGGLFLKRVLAIGALGSAIGLPAGLVMIFPDILPPYPEPNVEFILWLWWCVVLGLSINLAVQLLLSRGDPVTLLKRELATRLEVVAQALRCVALGERQEAVSTSLRSLSIAGMSRPLALLKSAAMTRPWARERREVLAALITLADRLVTAAVTLEKIAEVSVGRAQRERLLKLADECEQTRLAFEELRLPEPIQWAVGDAEADTEVGPLIIDMERTLDRITRAMSYQAETLGEQAAQTEERTLFLPDAFDNPEYVRFAVKGTLAALICYICFIGFDYPGIYTSVVTCFVVSLSTIGASNQKGVLRFGGAAVGGAMGLIALVYLFPKIDTIGGFWLVFGAGTAVAAWINFGSPRISYGGYQTGLAFYKATLQGFGPAISATVVRDRLIGVLFGLIVFGVVEHMLWPVRAADRMAERLADVLLSLAGLSLACSGAAGAEGVDVDRQRRLISQQVADVQGFIESSKFEPRGSPREIERMVEDAQSVFLILLALARDERGGTALPGTVLETMRRLDSEVAATLTAVAEQIRNKGGVHTRDVDAAMSAVEKACFAAGRSDGELDACRSIVALYRELIAATKRLSSEAAHTRLFAAQVA